jgi:hypothetical protein
LLSLFSSDYLSQEIKWKQNQLALQLWGYAPTFKRKSEKKL